MQNLATNTYAQPNASVKSPKALEYDLFARMTRALTRVSGPNAKYEEKAGALHANRMLWTKLAALVADPANALGADVRAGLLSLAQFSIAQTHRVLRDDADMTPLIDVNTAVMTGLRQTGPQPGSGE